MALDGDVTMVPPPWSPLPTGGLDLRDCSLRGLDVALGGSCEGQGVTKPHNTHTDFLLSICEFSQMATCFRLILKEVWDPEETPKEQSLGFGSWRG